MTAESEQKTARANVGDDWRHFRILAIESDRSIAEYLGQLVRDEIRRSRKRKRRVDEGADEAPEGIDPGATMRYERRRAIRLADAQLVNELPRPAESSHRSL